MNNETATATATPATTNGAYELTPEQVEVRAQIQALFDATKEKLGEGTIAQLKATKEIEAFARDHSGDDNKAKRVLMLSALVMAPVEEVLQTKAGIATLTNALNAAYLSDWNLETIRTEAPVIKKQKEDGEPEEDEVETALVLSFTERTMASKAVQKLSSDDHRLLQSIAHATFNLLCGRLGLPDAARNFLSILFGASQGKTAAFEATDEFLAEISRTSPSTIKRGRRALTAWMSETGKGVVDIKQSGKKSTSYTLNVLDSSTAIVQTLLSSSNASPAALVAIAGVTEKMLNEGRDKLNAKLSADQMEQVETFDTFIGEAMDSLPEPQIEKSESAAGVSKKKTVDKFEALSSKANTMKEAANELKLADLEKRADKLNTAIHSAQAAYEKAHAEDTNTVADFEPLTKELEEITAIVLDASKTAQEKANEKRAEAKASGTTDPRTIATEYLDSLALEGAVQDVYEEGVATITEQAYFVAEAAKRLEGVDPNKVFLQLQDALETAFGVGQHKPAAQ